MISPFPVVTRRRRAHDQAGRRVERASGPETTTYAYDPAGRLASSTSTRGQDARTRARTYDGQGTLVGVAVSGGDDQAATTLVWDSATPIPEIAVVREANNEVNLVYGAGRALALHDEDVTVFDYDASHSALRDDDSLVRAQRYDVFGLPGDSSDTAITFGYRGEAHIGDLVHLRARDYDPETGTFTTRDPLDGVPGTPSATNPYPYADNDPLNKVDPLGLWPWDDYTPGDIWDATLEAVSGNAGGAPEAWVDYWEDYGGDEVDAFIDKYGYVPDTGEILQIVFNPGFAFLDSCILQGSKFSALDCALASVDLVVTATGLGKVTLSITRTGTRVTRSIWSRTGAGGAAEAAARLEANALAAELGVQPYRALTGRLSGSGLQAHHLIERRFASVLGESPSQMLSVAVTRAEHQAFTNAWRQAIPYGAGTANATRQQVLDTARQIYANHPEILRALGL